MAANIEDSPMHHRSSMMSKSSAPSNQHSLSFHSTSSSSSLLYEKPNHVPYSPIHFYHLFISPLLADAFTRRLFYFSLFTLCFTVLEIMIGVMSGSLSLLSDGLHMGFDSLVLTANLVLSKSILSTTMVTKWKPFGWLRVEPFAGLLNAGLLMILSLNVAAQALYRLFWSPLEELETDSVTIVACIGLAINLFGIFAFNGMTHAHCLANHDHDHSHPHPHSHSCSHPHPHLHSHSHSRSRSRSHDDHHACHDHAHHHPSSSMSLSTKDHTALAINIDMDPLEAHPQTHDCSHTKGKNTRQPSMFLQGMFLHVLTDALGSLSVILSSLVIRYTGWTIIDPLCSLGLSGLILKVSWPLLSESVYCLLDWAPATVDMIALEHAIYSLEPHMKIELLRVWSLTRDHHVATLKLILSDQAHDDNYNTRPLHQRIRQIFDQYHIGDVTIEIQ